MDIKELCWVHEPRSTPVVGETVSVPFNNKGFEGIEHENFERSPQMSVRYLRKVYIVLLLTSLIVYLAHILLN